MYGFSCSVCKASVKRSDWCVIRDVAIDHLKRCVPHELKIYSSVENAANSGVIVFKASKRKEGLA